MQARQLNHRLVHTCKVALPEKGGVQIVANEVLKSLAGHFKSTLISTTKTDSPPPPVIEGLDYILKKPHFELKSLPISPSLITSLWQSAKQATATVVHYPFPLADLAVSLWPERFNRLIIYWHSDIIEQKHLNKLLAPLTHRMLKKSTAIVVASPKLIEHSSFLNAYKSKCVVIPFGYQPDAKQSVSDEGFYLCIGRHVKYKGMPYLIRALAKTSVKLVIIGSGPLLDEHRQLAERLNLAGRITFLTGASDKQVIEQLCRCRTLIMPSISPNEAFGLVQIEALSYGKPVINTQLNSAVPWVARDGSEAITVEPFDVEGLADAINTLEQDKDLRQSLAANAYARWQSTFAMPLFRQRTLEFFNKVCDV